jgi:CDP-glucose 4,6-dehydratase
MTKASTINSEFYRGKRVFITGHTGFKGAWLTQILYELGAVSSGFALPAERGCLFEKTNAKELITNIEGDIRNSDEIATMLLNFQPEIVIHLAAKAIVSDCFNDPLTTYDTNVMGTVNLFEAIRKCPTVKSVLTITTDKVYENKGDGAIYKPDDPLGGIDPYSASKTCMEFITNSYKNSYLKATGVATARASNVIAGGDHVQSRLIPSILNGFANGTPVELRNPDQTRPWQSVLDAMNGYLTIARKLYENPTDFSTAWNIGHAKEGICSVGEVFNKMRDFFNTNSDYAEVPKFAVSESQTLGLDISRSVELLAWQPEQSLDKMLYDLTDFFKRQQNGEPERSICLRQINDFFNRR